MPWNRRRARLNEIQLQRTNGTLSTQLLQLREQLRNKESYAAGLEILLRRADRPTHRPSRSTQGAQQTHG